MLLLLIVSYCVGSLLLLVTAAAAGRLPDYVKYFPTATPPRRAAASHEISTFWSRRDVQGRLRSAEHARPSIIIITDVIRAVVQQNKNKILQ